MKKHKVILSVLIIVIVGFTGIFVYDNYFKPYKWEKAEENISRYIKEQGVSKENISEITKLKDTALREENLKKSNLKGIIYTVTYKDDPKYEYQYFYVDDMHDTKLYKVALLIYDLSNGNKRVRGEDLKNVKYPPLYLDK